jgi:putative copper export protein
MSVGKAVAFWVGALVLLAILLSTDLGRAIPRNALVEFGTMAALGFYFFSARKGRKR